MKITFLRIKKIYLLSDEEEGKYRVIVGSANFSARAWDSSKQREVILVSDEKESYQQIYQNYYLPYRDSCTSEVNNLKAKLRNLERNGFVDVEDVPLLNRDEDVVIIEKTVCNEPDVTISMSDCDLFGGLQSAQADKLEKCFLEIGNNIAISRENVNEFKMLGEKIKSENALKKKDCPKLTVSWDDCQIYLNGRALEENAYERDVECIVEFINSFSLFSGDSLAYQMDAWKIMVWYFATPFFSNLRRACINLKQEGLLISLPMFCFLYGDANAGKTSLFKFLGKAMCGEFIEPLEGKACQDGVPPRKIRSNTVRKPRLMQVNQKGLPVLYDDVPSAKMNGTSLRNLLTSNFSKKLDMEYDGYPAVVATSNIIPPTPQEFQKRALFFQVSASLNQKQAIENGHIPNNLTEMIGSDFFAEYVQRVLPKMREAVEATRIASLDVYKISSEAILTIFEEMGKTPRWASLLTIDDYFGEEAMCQRASRNLKRYFTAYKENFERNTDKNQLVVRYGPGDRNSAKLLENIKQQLPPRFGAEFSAGMLTCNLREAEKLCGVKFSPKESWWRKFLALDM